MSYASALGLVGTKIFIQNYKSAEQNPHTGLTEGLAMVGRSNWPDQNQNALASGRYVHHSICSNSILNPIMLRDDGSLLLALSSNKDRHIVRHV